MIKIESPIKEFQKLNLAKKESKEEPKLILQNVKLCFLENIENVYAY